MNTSDQLNELAGALAKAQGEITGALKDSANPFFKSKYADLASCWDACRAALSKNGLAVTQFPTTQEGSIFLETTLLHTSGQWMRSSLAVNPKDDTPQAMGSALTYARRYALTAVVGVAQVDDDGNQASGRNEGHSHKGDMGKHVDPKFAMDAAATVLAILESDVDDQVKALHVLDRHDELNKNQDLYVAAMDNVSAKMRSAWKSYITMGKAAARADAASAPTNGRRF